MNEVTLQVLQTLLDRVNLLSKHLMDHHGFRWCICGNMYKSDPDKDFGKCDDCLSQKETEE